MATEEERRRLVNEIQQIIEEADGDVGLILTEYEASNKLAERIVSYLEKSKE
jgi:hypothetical protein